MDLLETIAAARERRRVDRLAGRTVVLVPTMGALHDGHLSLVRRAVELGDSVWVSVFVNPTQFGPGEDLDAYPRDLEGDLAKLEPAGAHVVFAPGAHEMYPREPVVQVGFSGLEHVLCGARRPGHFAGVGLVVTKLFNIVQPGVAVFGQKDAQQSILIERLVADLDLPVQIEVAPTVREPDGLAMSSRNAYLTERERRAASALYRALCRGRDLVRAGERDPGAVAAAMAAVITSASPLVLEYAECVSRVDLRSPVEIVAPVLLAVAAQAGRARLIDNLSVDPPARAEGGE